jgi:hypothetical protein
MRVAGSSDGDEGGVLGGAAVLDRVVGDPPGHAMLEVRQYEGGADLGEGGRGSEGEEEREEGEGWGGGA